MNGRLDSRAHDERVMRRCRDENASMSVPGPVTRIPDVSALVEKFQDLDVVIDHMADCPPDRHDLLRCLLTLRR
jgi:predicted TIM-barrel fold metal-dependent hydrolase